MRPISLTQTGAGSTSVIVPDYLISPFALGVAVVVSGTVNYTVEHTFDDVFSSTFNPSTATWIPHPSLTAQTATKDSNYAFPVRGIRLTQASGAGSSTLTIVQAGTGA